MSLVFPLQCREIEESVQYISMSVHHTSSYIVYLTSDGIVLRDINQYNHPIIADYHRSPESISEVGPNHWIQCLDNANISFGTCAGSIFFVHFNSETKTLKEKNHLNLNSIITATFARQGCLCICNSRSSLHFFDSTGKSLSVLSLDLGTGIHDAQFFSPHLLSCVIDGKPALMSFQNHPTDVKQIMTLSYISADSTMKTAMNVDKDLIGIALGNGSVVLSNIKAQSVAPSVLIEPPTKPNCVNEVIFMKWICDGQLLIIIQQNGDFTLYSLVTCSIHKTHIKEIANSNALMLDNSQRNILCLSKEKLIFLELASIQLKYAYTASGIFDIKTKKFALFEQLYPITGVNFNQYYNYYVISNQKGFVKMEIDGTCSELVKLIPSAVAFLNNNIYVWTFSQTDNQYFIYIYNQDLVELKSMAFSHAPLYIRTSQNTKLVVSCHTKFTVISENPGPIPNSFELDLSISSTVEQIQQVLYDPNIGTVLLMRNGKIQTEKGNLIYDNNVSLVISTDEPPLIIYQRKDGYYVHYSSIQKKFIGAVNYSDGADAYVLKKYQNFGEISFASTRYAPFLITIDIEELAKPLLKIYSKFPQFVYILAESLILSFENDSTVELFEILEEFNSKDVAEAFMYIINKLDEENREELFEMDIKYSHFFESLSKEVQDYSLVHMSNQCFRCLMLDAKHLVQANVKTLLPKLIQNRKIMRCFNVCSDFGIDFPQYMKPLESQSFKDSVQMFFDVFKSTRKEIITKYCIIGALLAAYGLNSLGLAAFVVTKSIPKIQALLSISPELIDIANKYTSEENVIEECVNTINEAISTMEID